jgi:porphobilinogen synthase
VRRFLHRDPLTPADLVMPILIRQGPTASPLPTFSLDEVGPAAAELARLGVGAVKLFAGGAERSTGGGDAASPFAPMIHAIEQVKAAVPHMAVITENCLCSYTEGGLCVLANGGRYDHQGTLDMLATQAVQQARAGADIIGPASMVDGHTGHVRRALDAQGHHDVALMPHLIFTSTMYGGYREAMRAVPRGNRAAFQVHVSRFEQGVRVARRMVQEGADMLLLEPAVHTVDLLAVLGREMPDVPLVPFAVSGEWAEITYSGQRPASEYVPALLERLRMYKRAGAGAVVTYSAREAAERV